MGWRHAALLVAACVVLLALQSGAEAKKSRRIGGEGLIKENLTGVDISTIWRFGLTQIEPGDQLGIQAVQYATGHAITKFGQQKSFKVVDLGSGVAPVGGGNINVVKNLDSLTPEQIIDLGKEHNIDALWGGRVLQAKEKNSWGTKFARLQLEIYLYSTQNGLKIWSSEHKKEQNTATSNQYGWHEIMPLDQAFNKLFYNIIEDSIRVMMEDGVTGRDVSEDSPATMRIAFPPYALRTMDSAKGKYIVEPLSSLGLVTGQMEDDFGLKTLVVWHNNAEAYRVDFGGSTEGQWQGMLEFCDDDAVEFILTDVSGAKTCMLVDIDCDNALEGEIASVAGDVVFVNLGAYSGAKKGMLFRIVSSVDIVDPSTGEVLGSSEVQTGVLKIVKVEDKFSRAELVEGELSEIKGGERIR